MLLISVDNGLNLICTPSRSVLFDTLSVSILRRRPTFLNGRRRDLGM